MANQPAKKPRVPHPERAAPREGWGVTIAPGSHQKSCQAPQKHIYMKTKAIFPFLLGVKAN
jgi:hypothetical protein